VRREVYDGKTTTIERSVFDTNGEKKGGTKVEKSGIR